MAKTQTAMPTIALKSNQSPNSRATIPAKGTKAEKADFGEHLSRAEKLAKGKNLLRKKAVEKRERNKAVAPLFAKGLKPNSPRVDMPSLDASKSSRGDEEVVELKQSDFSDVKKAGATDALEAEVLLSALAGQEGRQVSRRSAEVVKRSGKTLGTTGPSPQAPIGVINADFQSRDGRVEVIDRRGRAITEVKAMRADGRRSGHSEVDPGVFRTETVDGARGETRIAVLETELGVSNRSGARFSEGSAASELARRLNAEAGSDIVQQVKVVLNRADAGEIRINLRPEHLGRVRVRIQMEDNRLSGRIFVESAAAREAFRAAIDGLQVKLVESGFGAADLELAWDEGSMKDPRSGEHFQKNLGNKEAALGEFEIMSGLTVEETGGNGRINMVI